ncbi:hypothetical protein R3P38DRAFT_3237795 [Favolaschia claudopus]|uniref:Uncharacterized protein n=1 Tax=Favolaschia claudopus TaxID=2862362 RepID=A0AAV9ZAD1_9AGAR
MTGVPCALDLRLSRARVPSFRGNQGHHSDQNFDESSSVSGGHAFPRFDISLMGFRPCGLHLLDASVAPFRPSLSCSWLRLSCSNRDRILTTFGAGTLAFVIIPQGVPIGVEGFAHPCFISLYRALSSSVHMDSAPLALLKESASSSIDRALLRFMDSLWSVSELRVLLTGAILSTSSDPSVSSEVFCLLFRWVLCDLEPVTQEYRVQRARLSLVWSLLVEGAVLLSHFHSILPTSARWTRLEVVSTSTYAHKAILDHIGDWNSPALRCLTLRCPSRGALVTPVPTAVSVSCTNLRRLVLHRCNFPEAFPASLPNLTVLSLCDLPTIHSPTRTQLFRLLGSAPRLERLELDDPSPSVSRVAIPSVTTLVLAFNVTLHPARAFFHILEHIEALNLSHLHLGLPRTLTTVHELRGGSVALREFLPCHAFGLGRSGQTICVATIRVSSWFAYTAGVAFAHCLRVRPLHWVALTDGLSARLRVDSARVQLVLVPHQGAGRLVPSEHSSAYHSLMQVVDSATWGNISIEKLKTILRYPGLDAD